MFTPSLPCLVALITVGLCATSILWASEQQIALREHLSQRWTRELVSFPFSAERGACHRDSIRLTGPGGPTPVQASDVDYWPDTQWVRSAQLSFVVDLTPQAEDSYCVSYSSEPTAPEPPATDLQVTGGEGVVELATSKSAVRLLLGEQQYPIPLSPERAPGPIVSMRLADGTWCGGSRLYGKRKVAAYSSSLSARGPVFAQVELCYRYEDGNRLTLSAQLAAGDSQMLWRMDCDGHAPEDGWHLLVTPGLDRLEFVYVPEFGSNRWGKHEYIGGRWVADPVDVAFEDEPPGTLMWLVPWSDWWEGQTKTRIVLKAANKGEVLAMTSADPGEWIPAAAPGTWVSWGNPRMREQWVPLVDDADGDVFFEFSCASGKRKWQIGAPRRGVGRRLEEVKDYVLDWPADTDRKHPFLYLTQEQLEERRTRGPADERLLRGLKSGWRQWRGKPHGTDGHALSAYLLTGSREVAKEARLVDRLRHHLALLGNFDLMRHTCIVVNLYDGVIDSDLVSRQERRLFRAQIAYLGYRLADPATWSMERGYCSGNNNMTVSYILNLGTVACAIPDHPAAQEWVRGALMMMDKWLGEHVGPAGEWPESVSNYVHVSASNLLLFAITARNAGFHDYLSDPRLKKLMLYMAKQYTPPDPRRGNVSVLPPSGRGGAGGRWGLAGMMAQATAETDPAYSRVQQWSWLRTDASRSIPNSILAGLEQVYLDGSLPSVAPDWGTELFPQVGAIMRHGVGTSNEHCLNFVVTPFTDWYASESGAFAAIFAKGVPIACRFAGGYAEREELLISRVLLARGRGSDDARRARFYHEGKHEITGFSALPRQDYLAADLTIEKPRHIAHKTIPENRRLAANLPEWPRVEQEGTPPLHWRRQALFMKDDDPAGANYLVLRDTVSGDQPTMWQFWTLSNGIATPEQAAGRDRLLADQPTPPRALTGDRFTAIGQFGVDVEFYVPSPTETPRHTLRWGKTYDYSPINGFSEYQDLLHLQMEGDGAYYVVVFPRKRDESVPQFQTVGGGYIVKVSGDFGADYAFLACPEATVEEDGAMFRGTAASVQDREKGLVLSLGVEGEVRYRDYGLAARSAVSLRVSPRTLVIHIAHVQERTEIALRAPGAWVIDDAVGVELRRDEDARYVVSAPAGVEEIRLTKQ